MAIQKGQVPSIAQWIALIGWMLVVIRCQDVAPSREAVDDGHYDVPLLPFQIRLLYDDNEPMAKSDEMSFLNSTQHYLSSRLTETEPDFWRLFLYQFVRDFGAYSHAHYSKIAMNGIVYFDTPMNSTRNGEVQAHILHSFMGENIDHYIDALHSGGMTHVVDATLLSMKGHEMVDHEGQIVESSSDPEGERNETERTREMDDVTRRMTLLLCLLVPAIAILIATIAFASRSSQEIKKWGKVNFLTAVDQSAWQIREFRVIDPQSALSLRAKELGQQATDSDEKS